MGCTRNLNYALWHFQTLQWKVKHKSFMSYNTSINTQLDKRLIKYDLQNFIQFVTLYKSQILD